MKASNHLCICSQCKFRIRSCALYNEYELQYEDIYPAQLRSSVLAPVAEEVEDCRVDGFIIPESVVAVAAAADATDTIWFVKVTETNCIGERETEDSYKNIILRAWNT